MENLKRVDNEYQIKTILFLNDNFIAGIKCEDRHDGFYAESDDVLSEFLDGYKSARNNGTPYEDVDDPEQVKLMDSCIPLMEDVIDGNIEYTSSGQLLIQKAIMTFGL